MQSPHKVAVAAAFCLAFAQAFAQAPAPSGDAAPAPAAAAPGLATVADPDTLFKGQMGGTFGKNVIEVMPAGKRIAVAAFRVAFITDNKISAQVRGAYLPGIDYSGARSSFFVALKGVDAKTMQAVTDKAYADLLQQLAASGREVVPLDQLKESFGVFKASASGYTKEANGQTASFFAPTGMPLVFTHLEGGWGDSGMLDLTNYRKLQEVSAKLDAVVIAPMMFVNFAKMSSSGNQSGLVARTAETGAEPGMSVAGFNSVYIRTDEFRNGMLMKGDEGSFRMTGAVTSELPVGAIQVQSQEDNQAIRTAINIIGFAAGMRNAGGAARSSTRAVVETSDDAYAAAANDALQRTSSALARWFRKYPPAN
jgi:hypothetical protein